MQNPLLISDKSQHSGIFDNLVQLWKGIWIFLSWTILWVCLISSQRSFISKLPALEPQYFNPSGHVPHSGQPCSPGCEEGVEIKQKMHRLSLLCGFQDFEIPVKDVLC